jgi:hypothetical protein
MFALPKDSNRLPGDEYSGDSIKKKKSMNIRKKYLGVLIWTRRGCPKKKKKEMKNLVTLFL